VNTELQSAINVRTLIPLKENQLQQFELPPFITISYNKGFRIIPHQDILFLKSESNYTNFYLKNGKKILCSKTLKTFQDLLPSSVFYRVHRSYLIPLNLVRSLNTSPFTLKIGEHNIPVSKDSKSFIKSLFLGSCWNWK